MKRDPKNCVQLDTLDEKNKAQHLMECQDCRLDLRIEEELRLTPEKSHALVHRKRAHDIVDLFHQDPQSEKHDKPFRLPLARIAAILFIVFGLSFWLLNRPQKTTKLVKVDTHENVQSDTTQLSKNEKPLFKKIVARQVAGFIGNGTEFSEGANINLEESQSLLAINDMKVLLYLQNDTKVILEKLQENEIEVRLISGSLFMDVLPNQGMIVKVHTNQGSVKVIGTVFYVEANNTTKVGVLRGKVEFSTPEHKTQITKNEVFNSKTKRLDSVNDARRTDIFTLIRKSAACTSSLFSFHTSPQNARLKIDGTYIANSPFQVLLCEGKHEIEVSKGGYQTKIKEFLVNKTAVDLHLKLEKIETLEVKKKKAIPPGAQDLLRQARMARINKEWPKAKEVYVTILKNYPQDRAAKIARIALGDLERGPLSHPRKALRHYRAYQKMGGRLVVEAYYGEIMVLKKLGRSSEEKTKIIAFLKRFPSALQGRRLKKRLNEL